MVLSDIVRLHKLRLQEKEVLDAGIYRTVGETVGPCGQPLMCQFCSLKVTDFLTCSKFACNCVRMKWTGGNSTARPFLAALFPPAERLNGAAQLALW